MSRYYDPPAPPSHLYPPNNLMHADSRDNLDSNYNGREEYDSYEPNQSYNQNQGYQDQSYDQSRGTDNPYNSKQPKNSHTMRWIIAALVLALLAGVGGIVGWRVSVGKQNNKSASTDSTGSSSGSSVTNGAGNVLSFQPGTANAVKWMKGDPSQFESDPRLHKSFYGVAYNPFGAYEPAGCTAEISNVTEDIIILSQLTNKLRLYGSACNISQLVLQAIQDTKVDMTVFLGVYIGPDEAVNSQQMKFVLDAIKLYGPKHVAGVIVGNEYILNALNPSTASTYIIAKMATFRTMLKTLNLSVTIPVGNADAGSLATTRLSTGSDFWMANVHPFFGFLPIAQAAAWTTQYFTENDVSASAAAPNNPPTYIAETGWPTNADTVVARTNGGAYASVPNLQIFLDTFICPSNVNGTKTFYFAAFDEPWKAIFPNSTEIYWGLFDANKVLKNITIPSCAVTAK